MHMLR
jgi:tetratricopeptide (TPR) repeat protein